MKEPNILNGWKIYNEVSITGGAELDFFKNIRIPYDWNDFADLVAYERASGTGHSYSAMIAVNLMKCKLKSCNYYFKEASIGDENEAFSMFLIDNYIQINKIIPKWDISCGVYFDKYYFNWVHDVQRQTQDAMERIKNSVSFEYASGPDNSFMDTIEAEALSSSQFDNNSTYDNPEDIYISKETSEVRDILFSKIDDKDFSLDKKKACVTTFLCKFMDGIILDSRNMADRISDLVNEAYERE